MAKRPKVYQNVFRVTILSADKPISDNMDLQDALVECDEGEFIGLTEVMKQEEVKPRSVRRKLLAMGNDGEFFNTGEE
jgi:hypothetical protein